MVVLILSIGIITAGYIKIRNANLLYSFLATNENLVRGEEYLVAEQTKKQGIRRMLFGVLLMVLYAIIKTTVMC